MHFIVFERFMWYFLCSIGSASRYLSLFSSITLFLSFSLSHSLKLKIESEAKAQGTGLFQGETK